MRCPKCREGKTGVVDTTGEGLETLRRRKCRACGHVFYTSEVVDYGVKSLFHRLKAATHHIANEAKHG